MQFNHTNNKPNHRVNVSCISGGGNASTLVRAHMITAPYNTVVLEYSLGSGGKLMLDGLRRLHDSCRLLL